MMMTDGKIRKVSSLFLVISLLLSNTASFASTSVKSRSFHIRQEVSSAKGVLVSKPNNEDLTITRFLARHKLTSIEKYYKWLEENFKYIDGDDTEEYVKSVDLLKRKTGDCDDYAFLTSSVVRVLGFKPRFIALMRDGKAHAVCIFKKNGYFVMFDNSKIYITKTQTIEEFGDYVTGEYAYNKLIELDLDTKEWNTVYEKA